MERVLSGSGVERIPVPPETSYVGELFRALREALLQGLLRGAEMLRVPREVLIAAAVLAVVAALFLIVRALRPRFHARRREPGAVAAVEARAAELLDAPGWRAELERRLAAGRTAEALEAAWWWLARSLAGSRAEPDWTSRDLVARARRQDLADLVRRLDLLAYGPRRPGLDDVRTLVARMEEALS
ncbi:MAG TPA: hypothetical protein VGG03_12090 [Thermoanaerobaculia bacterium]